MKWLLWKEYRHNRLIVFTALVLLLAPYLIGFGVLCGGRWFKVDWTEWKIILGGACAYSILISHLTFALLGGNAISGERVDRSAEFLYALPFTRRKLLAGKLLFALAITAVIWLTTALVGACLLPWTEMPPLTEWPHVLHKVYMELPNLRPEAYEALLGMGDFAITGVMFFCVSWFCSSYIASPASDVCAGLLAPVLVISGIGLVDAVLILSGRSETHISGHTIALWYGGICLVLAPVCFAIGTWHYLRRVEP
jgi:hypothetical protein